MMSPNNDDSEVRFALHLIDDPTRLTFDRQAYSRYKYGDSALAQQFGRDLCAGFIREYHDFLVTCDQQLMGMSSPQNVIPHAAYYLFQAFLKELNHFLQANGRKPMIEHVIHRVDTIGEDYSLMTSNERFVRLHGQQYSIDPKPLKDKVLLFVDDIRITGMHEMYIIRLLNNSNIFNPRFFIYFIQLINDQISSSLEYQLNTCAVSTLDHLREIIDNPTACFKITTRGLKEILRSNLTQRTIFFQHINIDFMSQLYHACLACHYQDIETLADGLRHMHDCLQERQRETTKDKSAALGNTI